MNKSILFLTIGLIGGTAMAAKPNDVPRASTPQEWQKYLRLHPKAKFNPKPKPTKPATNTIPQYHPGAFDSKTPVVALDKNLSDKQWKALLERTGWNKNQ